MSFPNQAPVYGVIPQPFYPVQTVGMVGMMVPSTATVNSLSSLTQATITTPAIISRPPTTVNRQPQNLKDASDKPPVTTVFVGNITEKAPDLMIKQLLQRCGNVLSWKRVQGASGKLQAFGFCEYEDPEATLRCIRLLNEWRIGDKNLVVKVDPKTKELLDDYKRKKREAKSADNSVTSERGTSESPVKKAAGGDTAEVEDVVDEITLRDDETVRLGLQSILREYASDLKKGMDSDDKSEDGKRSGDKRKDRLEGPRHLTIEDMDLDNDRKDLINREIETFRNRHKTTTRIERGDLSSSDVFSEEDDREEARERERDREARRRRLRQEQDSSSSQRRDPVGGSTAATGTSGGSSSHHHHHHRSSSSHRNDSSTLASSEAAAAGGSSRVGGSSGLREDSSSRGGTSSRKRSRSRSRDVANGSSRSSRSFRHDEQEEAMRKKLERELRKKEAAYQERLKQWEGRERKKLKEYEREKEREFKLEHEGQAEARRLKEFFEDYDDDQLDSKYYKGSALQKRLKDRQLEEVADERDRAKEIEEIEETRRKLMASGDPEAETTIWQMEQRMQEHLCKRLNLDFDQLPVEAEMTTQTDAPMAEPMDELAAPESVPLSEPTAMLANGGLAVDHGAIAEVEKTAAGRSRSSSSSGGSSSDGEDAGQYAFAATGADDNYTSPPHQPSISQHTPALPSTKQSVTAETAVFGLGAAVSSVDASAAGVNVPVASDDTSRASVLTSSTRPSMVSTFTDENSSRHPEETKSAAVPPPVPAAAATLDKKQIIKQIIDQIPTQKQELFAYPIDWTLVDRTFVNNRIRPWVDKKIMAYIGEEEPQLSNFICEKVLAHNSPDTILQDIAMVLDEEAEVFVVKMWRLLIYVIKEKNAGLDKS